MMVMIMLSTNLYEVCTSDRFWSDDTMNVIHVNFEEDSYQGGAVEAYSYRVHEDQGDPRTYEDRDHPHK